MKDKSFLFSAVMACSLHVVVLFLNIGAFKTIPPVSLPMIEVSLLAPPALSAEESQPLVPKAPEPASVARPKRQSLPKPVHEPIVEPKPVEDVPPSQELPDKDVLEEAPVLVTADIEAVPNLPEPPTGAAGDSGGLAEGGASAAALSGNRASATQPFGISQGDFSHPPTYSHNPKPPYPESARRLGQEGSVLLLVEVLANGRVGGVEVEKPSGVEALDDAAVTAVKQWRFKPALKGRRPVRAWVRIPIEFSLKD